MAFLLFSCSLRDGSRSQVMVQALRTELEGAGHKVEYLDLREAGLPLCDGDDCYDHPATKALRASGLSSSNNQVEDRNDGCGDRNRT
ncbi:MAG: NAD(P)H-dependent oxidoreductase [Candidatus Poseidoniia archaeon]|nr:NAD(P)H-dependent oxidoreductase [Candidatus Poseidoniia archaeon]